MQMYLDFGLCDEVNYESGHIGQHCNVWLLSVFDLFLTFQGLKDCPNKILGIAINIYYVITVLCKLLTICYSYF